MCFVVLRIAEVDCCSGRACIYDILVGIIFNNRYYNVFCFVLFVKKRSMMVVDNCNGNEQNSIINNIIAVVVVVTGTGPPQSFGFVWVFFFNHFLVVLFFRFDGGRSSGRRAVPSFLRTRDGFIQYPINCVRRSRCGRNNCIFVDVKN